MITKKEIEGLAKLSCLALTDEEKERLAVEMSDIIAFADTINKSVTEGDFSAGEAPVNYTSLREDEVTPSYPSDEILADADSENGFFAVRRNSLK